MGHYIDNNTDAVRMNRKETREKIPRWSPGNRYKQRERGKKADLGKSVSYYV